jgi:hypothetical protein
MGKRACRCAHHLARTAPDSYLLNLWFSPPFFPGAIEDSDAFDGAHALVGH